MYMANNDNNNNEKNKNRQVTMFKHDLSTKTKARVQKMLVFTIYYHGSLVICEDLKLDVVISFSQKNVLKDKTEVV